MKPERCEATCSTHGQRCRARARFTERGLKVCGHHASQGSVALAPSEPPACMSMDLELRAGRVELTVPAAITPEDAARIVGWLEAAKAVVRARAEANGC